MVPHQAASRIGRIDKDGKVSVYLENTNGTGGIGLDPKGRLISVETSTSQIGVLAPSRGVLADSFEGTPLARLSDIVVDRLGGVYFTDGPHADPQVGRVLHQAQRADRARNR